MFKLILAVVVCATFSQSSRAKEFRPSQWYQISTGDMIQAYDFDEERGTAITYSYADYKKREVSIDDLSPETDKEINGVKQGSLVLINLPDHEFCVAYNVFENGIAYINCQVSGTTAYNVGMNRPATKRYFVGVQYLLGEVQTFGDFSKNLKGRMKYDHGSLKKGDHVKIEAVFTNGRAIVQKLGFNVLDTSQTVMKFNNENVSLVEIAPDAE